jgi:orotidine-5'-phosphate decarboxylase
MPAANFADRLGTAVRNRKSRLVVGLDPDWAQLPQHLRDLSRQQLDDATAMHAWAIRSFCEEIIRATRDIAVAFKPQIAFFERYGSEGIRVLELLLDKYKEELFIVDCKRGDIGNTSAAYAEAYFGELDGADAPLICDAVTHNGYLGGDSIEPYMPYLRRDKGMFMLARTSNPGSSDLQELSSGELNVSEHVAALVARLGESCVGESGYSSLGLVAGAPFPEQARGLRELAPRAWFLVPGLATQGGKVEDAPAFVNEDGLGAIYSFSRAVIFAYRGMPDGSRLDAEQFARAARDAAIHYRDALNSALPPL